MTYQDVSLGMISKAQWINNLAFWVGHCWRHGDLAAVNRRSVQIPPPGRIKGA